MIKKTKKPTKKPQDLTLRNLRAMKKRIVSLECSVAAVTSFLDDTRERVFALEDRLTLAKQGIFVGDKRAKR